jgi:hypothetical protein
MWVGNYCHVKFTEIEGCKNSKLMVVNEKVPNQRKELLGEKELLQLTSLTNASFFPWVSYIPA